MANGISHEKAGYLLNPIFTHKNKLNYSHMKRIVQFIYVNPLLFG